MRLSDNDSTSIMDWGIRLAVARGVGLSIFRFSTLALLMNLGETAPALSGVKGADNSHSFLSTLAEVTFLLRQV